MGNHLHTPRHCLTEIPCAGPLDLSDRMRESAAI